MRKTPKIGAKKHRFDIGRNPFDGCDGAQSFFQRYPIRPPFPHTSLLPRFHWREDVPYVLLMRYELDGVDASQLEKLLAFPFRFLADFQEIKNGVRRSPNGDYWINVFYEDGKAYNILIQAMAEGDDEDKIIIYNAKDTIQKGFLGERQKDTPHHDLEDALEEVYEPGGEER